MLAVFGPRPVAISSFSTVSFLTSPFSVLKCDFHAVSPAFALSSFALVWTSIPFLVKTRLQFFRNLFVFERNDVGQHFEQSHFCAEAVVNGSELHSNRAAADDQHGLRNLIQISRAPILLMMLFSSKS